MNAAASAVVKEIPDLCIAYGVSDEYSFIFHKTTTLFDRRSSKLLSTIVSTFTAFYIHLWGVHFPPNIALQPPHLPTFDARAICYPTLANLRDYLSWRQVDCHINNLYNTTFWAMRQKGGMGPREVEEELKGTLASDKNEILWGRFGINYNDEKEIFKKGSVVFCQYELEEPAEGRADTLALEEDGASTAVPDTEPSKTQKERAKKVRAKASVVVRHIDIIKDDFWERRPWISSGKPGKPLAVEDQ
ncbi:tRNA(His) guanylyltransferase [Endocarpon pusillum Z07020]|uniref:tRNA(His) guanylyltransferase n=1 Tax=Endocarpon pusillum (strain Z07020 / HMAS-L-300199) TaxID=1263415 RepID=U1GAN9_ENDPU|nr:tRNA(His) guanylyltransferase [Endocarpon pusillum Z07020]ERF69078.1 tRNA(His) guanylyltransferase [Endocarpon pusillum Z07020]